MIHKFELNGYRIALDVNSGAVHVLDEATYALIDFVSEDMPEALPETAAHTLSARFGPEELAEAWGELYALYKQGQLCSKDNYAQYEPHCGPAPIKSMCLNIAHDCNLRCRYCFASTGDFGGGRKLMPLEVGKSAIDFLIRNSAGRRNLEVDFFGGEPLMNFDVVKRIVAYAREEEKKHGKNFRFTITTNALLLDDDKIDFINREMSNVVLSIDGRREVNDRMRVRVDGTGSYDAILPRIKRLCERRGNKDYYVRGTFTRENLDFMKDVLALADEGFDQISVEPVIGSEDEPYSIRSTDLPQIFIEYDALAKEIIRRRKAGKGFNFFHFMIDLQHGPCAIKLLRGCGCGNEYVAVTPDGDFYPCHQFVGHEEWKMGNVLTQTGIFESPMKEMFSHANIYTKQPCRNCWARFFCSGGCNANNSSLNGNILNPLPISCEMERKRVECALMVQAAMAE